MADYEEDDELLIETKPKDFNFVKEDEEVAICVV